jgi:cytidylate kinase
MIVAIDGPAGSGKSTVAKIVAERLGFKYINTGAMYRAVAWKAGQLGASLKDEAGIARVAEQLNLEFVPSSGGQKVLVDGEDVGARLKSEEVGNGAATVASQPNVRRILTDLQRKMGQDGKIVMEGRDIGTQVFPNANKKIFFHADPEERGRRRYTELSEKGESVDLNKIIEQIKSRDLEDMNRAVAPLLRAEDALLVDTTHLGIEEAVVKVLELIGPESAK